MRKRRKYRVCQCTPYLGITYLEAHLLHDMINTQIHAIRCAESCKWKFMKGSRLGDLCAETGHFWWARKIWRFTAELIEEKDYDDWVNVWFDNDRVRLRDVISETECELLHRRCSQLWRALGFPEYDWWDDRVEYLTSRYFGTTYYYLFAEKYDGYYDEPIGAWESMMEEYEAMQETQRIFHEAQGDWEEATC
ncbi:MAG: hypothetical protein IJ190_04945 [Prevotella sp.]|nr:hypothetical protein [Prevotella sp.]